MCDECLDRGRGWKGWQPARPSAAMRVVGDWIDLSHQLNADMPRVPQFPPPIFEQVLRLPEKQLNVTRMEMIVHMGTHIDSPRHFFLDGPALEDVPLSRLSGRGIVWPVHLSDDRLVEAHHLTQLEVVWRPGDILLLNTGWHAYVGTARYDNCHPALSLSAADWMVEHEVKLLGVDTPTPDLPVVKRPADFDYPIHRRLLSNGVLIAEHVTGLSPLNGLPVEVLCMGLNITGGDGAPARIAAREIRH